MIICDFLFIYMFSCYLFLSLSPPGTSVLYFFPLTSPVNSSSMNWLVVVVVGCTIIGVINWYTNSRYSFLGPTRYVNKTDVKNFLGLIRNARATPADANDLAAGEDFMKDYVAKANEEAAQLSLIEDLDFCI